MGSKRRGNGEGGIRQRVIKDKATGAVIDERWEARLTLEGGQHKSLYGATRQEVARKLTAALRARLRRAARRSK